MIDDRREEIKKKIKIYVNRLQDHYSFVDMVCEPKKAIKAVIHCSEHNLDKTIAWHKLSNYMDDEKSLWDKCRSEGTQNEMMQKMDGVYPYPSDANFILFKADNSDNIYNGLLKKKVLIRDMSGAINDCLRVTVGTPAENSAFLKALKQLIYPRA